MSESEKELLGSKSIDEISVDELSIKTAQASGKKSDKVGFFASLKAEFKKIIWPNRRSLGRQTLVVVICTIILGLIIFGIDIALTDVFDKIFVN